MLLEMFVIGISSVLLALEPNNNRIEGSFLKTVIIRSIPSAISLLIPTIGLLIVSSLGYINDIERSSIGMLAITLVGLINLAFICRPYTRWRLLVLGFAAVAIALFIPLGFLLNDYFGLMPIFGKPVILALALLISAAVAAIVQLSYKKIAALFLRVFKRKKTA